MPSSSTSSRLASKRRPTFRCRERAKSRPSEVNPRRRPLRPPVQKCTATGSTTASPGLRRRGPPLRRLSLTRATCRSCPTIRSVSEARAALAGSFDLTYQFGERGNLHLLHDAAPADFDRLSSDAEIARAVLVACADDGPAKHFTLPRSQVCARPLDDRARLS